MCLAANILSALSWSWPALLFFRIFLGAGMGVNSSTVSVYAAECAPSPIRGGLAVSWQMFTAFGIFVGFITNVAVYNVRYTTLRNWFFLTF
jgi:MFS family permease